MEQCAIRVCDVSKSFRAFYDKSTSLKEKALFKSRRRYEQHQVLKNINLKIKPGEAVGIIGANGSGKSTLLKLLSRIMYPDSGSIEMNGRVSALIELGAGFHPDMSGRENIYTNAAIFGLSKKEIDDRLDSIIEFSGLGEFIDNPVRTYSSGMYMRLAFSVAINVDADILLVDEILAVGDAAFQAKCFNKLREIKSSGTTIVIVSHALGQIEQFCDRSVWIKDGVIAAEGNPVEVNMDYLDYMGRTLGKNESTVQNANHPKEAEEDKNEKPSEEEDKSGTTDSCPGTRWGSGDASITGVRIKAADGEEKEFFATGEPITIEFDYTVKSKLSSPVVGIGIFRNDGLQCYGSNTQIDHMADIPLHEKGTVVCSLSRVDLLPGEYFVDVAIHRDDGFAYDYYRFARRFTMYSNANDIGVYRIGHDWYFR